MQNYNNSNQDYLNITNMAVENYNNSQMSAVPKNVINWSDNTNASKQSLMNEIKTIENYANNNMTGNMNSNNYNGNKGCSCNGYDMPRQPETRLPKDMPLAMAYVPFQMWEHPYDAPVALSRGTLFESLDKPFIGEEAVNNGKI